jgi:hypothetical protein
MTARHVTCEFSLEFSLVMSYGFSVEAQHDCSSGDLVHARVRRANEAVEIGNEEYFYF